MFIDSGLEIAKSLVYLKKRKTEKEGRKGGRKRSEPAGTYSLDVQPMQWQGAPDLEGPYAWFHTILSLSLSLMSFEQEALNFHFLLGPQII